MISHAYRPHLILHLRRITFPNQALFCRFKSSAKGNVYGNVSAAKKTVQRGSRSKRNLNATPKGKKCKLVFQQKGELLYSINAVLSALKHAETSGRHKIFKLHVQDSKLYESKRTGIHFIEELAKKMHVNINYTTKHSLNNITQNAKHQGVALDCSEVNTPTINLMDLENLSNDPASSRPPIILHLDEFNDPRNFGSVLRTAAFFGVDMITFAKKNSCPISPTVSVVAAGAVDELSAQNKLHAVNINTPDFLHAASSDCGYNIFGTLLNPNAIDATQMELSKPTILVFGNEGRGMRKQVSNACDTLYKIPTGVTNGTSSVDSLNVGVSVGVCLWQLLSSAKGNMPC
eukprot:g2639.t1